MDQLIKSVKKFSIDQNNDTFENSLDSIIDQMQRLETDLNVIEWNNLKSNFSKLRYLDYLIKNNNNITLSSKFNESLEIFLKNMDLTTQHYLNHIDFELPEYTPDLLIKTKKIKKYFDKSLNSNDNLIKMKYILNAYLLLVPIVEGYTNEPFKDELDRSFVQNFSYKKQKIN
jgi:hypothetical protein